MYPEREAASSTALVAVLNHVGLATGGEDPDPEAVKLVIPLEVVPSTWLHGIHESLGDLGQGSETLSLVRKLIGSIRKQN